MRTSRDITGKKARVLGVLTAAACLALGLAPQAQAEPGAWVSLQNPYNNACLGINIFVDSHPVTQGTCDARGWSSWHLSTDGWLRNGYMSGSCLDTNGTKLYLSRCNATDPGQLWERLPGTKVGVVSRGFPGKVLVGWADGSVSLAETRAVDNADKYKWKWNWQ